MSAECSQVEQKLELHVMGELPADEEERVRTHLARCARCQGALGRARKLLQELDLALGAPAPPPDLVRKVLIQIERRRARVRLAGDPPLCRRVFLLLKLRL